MTPSEQTILSGLASDTALGAGVGAAGMGAANLMGPRDPDNPDSRTKSLLKSMLLGAGLGGVVGAGGRSVADSVSQDFAHNPGSSLPTIFNAIKGLGTQKPPDNTSDIGAIKNSLGHAKNVLSGHPLGSALVAGSAVAVPSTAHNIRVNMKDLKEFNPERWKFLNEYKDTHWFERPFKYPTKFPGNHGLVAGAGVYGLSKLLEGIEQRRQGYEEVNQSSNVLRDIFQNQPGK